MTAQHYLRASSEIQILKYNYPFLDRTLKQNNNWNLKYIKSHILDSLLLETQNICKIKKLVVNYGETIIVPQLYETYGCDKSLWTNIYSAQSKIEI